MRFRIVQWIVLSLLAFASGAAEPRWWKGNLHTHSFWSDGDDFPEMITSWYVENGYQFLAISDHNTLQQGQRWLAVGTNQVRIDALEKYINRFGTNWVETRNTEYNHEVRLKPLSEYQPLFQKAGEFLLIQSEELTDKFQKLPVHINASNLREVIPPQGGNSVREVMQNNFDAIHVQARSTGQSILPHLNHPNFGWGVTAEDLAAIRGEKFFEVYNGHPEVHNGGDAYHVSTDRMWDIALCLRLNNGSTEPLYAIAVDDSHHYHKQGIQFSNAGRGWIMVRSGFLTPEHLIAAMERGDFYASSGVTLREINRSSSGISIVIEGSDGAEYRTEFIGTRKGFDIASEPVKDKEGEEMSVTRRYSTQMGETLATVEGLTPSYQFKGDELYVRARITSSLTKKRPSKAEEKEAAWTQPIFLQALR